MLVEVPQIPDSQLDVVDHEKAISCLELVAQAAKDGFHLVYLSRESLLSFAPLGLAPRVTNILTACAGRASENGMWISKVVVRAQVLWSDGIPSIRSSPDKSVISLPYAWVDNSSRIQPVSLLCENLTDADFYEAVAGRHREFVRAKLSFRHAHGGGSTTADVLRRLAVEDTLTLCICDGDRKWPDASPGETARRVLKEARPPRQHVEITNSREAENLIPLECWACVDSTLEYVAKHNLEVLSHAPLATRHVDMKEGLMGAGLLKHLGSENHCERDFWSQVSSACRWNLTCMSTDPCVQAGECSKSQCECILVKGLGSGCLARLVKCREGNWPVFRDVADAALSMNEELARISDVVGSWGLSRGPIIS